MNTTPESQPPALEAAGAPVIKIIGVGSAGVGLLEILNNGNFTGATLVAVNTDRASLATSFAPVKVLLEDPELRGLGTGGDAERGKAMADDQFSTLKATCAGANVIFLLAGLGGGAGSGITPVLARAARETGALVLGFVTLPFDCEGSRRREQARLSLEQIKAEADGVVCLPNQKAFKLIDENTSFLETFRISGNLLAEAIRGVWQLMTRPGLIQIHMADLCTLLRDKNSEGVFAYVEASGATRSREVVEKLLAHPLLDEGRALAESDAVLVSLMAGRDLTMAEVNRVMEQISRQCERAQVIMGASADESLKNRLSVTVIAARHGAAAASETADAKGHRGGRGSGRSATGSGFLQQREQQVKQHVPGGRRKPTDSKYRQETLPLMIISKGLFDKSEPTIHKGEDLDIPTYYRRGVPLN
jgi:cell division protein FtsZ